MLWDVLPYPCEIFHILILNKEILVRNPARMYLNIYRFLPARPSSDEFVAISHIFSRLLAVESFSLHFVGSDPAMISLGKIHPSFSRF